MTTLATNLVGDWLLNGLTVVNSVDAHTETAFGSPTLQHFVGSNVGVETDGTGMGFTAEALANYYAINGTDTMSGFAFVYPETPTGTGPLLSTRDVDSTGTWGFYLLSTRQARIFWNDHLGVNKVNLTSTAALSDATLGTVGFTINLATGIAQLYINGVFDSDNSGSSPLPFTGLNDGAALLLCGENSSARSFKGTAFRLSLWKNRVLTAGEFASLNTSPGQIYAGFANVVQSKFAAFPVVTQTATGSISNATNTSPIVITSTAHGQASGTVLSITGVGGNTAANGNWVITKVDANSFSLNGSTGNGTYSLGGSWTVVGVAVTLDNSVHAGNTLLAAIATYNFTLGGTIFDASNTTPIVITTNSPHGLSNGDHVFISGATGNTNANGPWTITSASGSVFTLVGSAGNANYGGGAWWNHPPTDNIGNAPWVQLGTIVTSGNNILSAWEAYHSAAGTPTVTIVPHAGSAGFITVMLFELQGIIQSAVDAFTGANGSSTTTASPGSITVSTAYDLVLTAFSQGNNNIDNATVNNGFTMIGLQTGGIAVECLGVAAKITGSTVTPTFSTFFGGSAQVTTWASLGVSLKATAGTGSVILFEESTMPKYIGDFTKGTTIEHEFNTFISDGTPTSLTGGTVQVVRDDGTTNTAQVTLTLDEVIGGTTMTGCHKVSVAVGGNLTFYDNGHEFHIQVTAGTVGGVPRLGWVPLSFSIGNRRADLSSVKNTAVTEGATGRLAASLSKLLDVATPRADVSGSSTGIVVTGDLLSKDDVAQCIWEPPLVGTNATFLVNHFATSGSPGLAFKTYLGTDSKVLVSTDVQDLSVTLSVNAKKIGGTNQTGFDIGLYATHAATTIELDPNSADPQNSLGASTYRLTSGTLYNQYKEITNGMNAYDVFGQVDFLTDSGTVNASTTGTVSGVAYDPVNNYLFEAESSNHRILVFKADPSQPNKTAIHVLGQANFTNHSANEGSTVTANSLNNPNGLWYDTGTKFLWVADSGNHRVGYYDLSGGISDHQALVHVLGQINKTSGSANQGGTTAAGTLNNPTSVCSNAILGWVAVTDASNNRVCIWQTAITADGQSANAFLGQSNSTGNSPGSTQTTISQPQGVAIDPDNARVFVGDTGNARCMIWGFHVLTGGAADNVLGQPDFTTHNSGRRTRAGLFDPGPGFSYDSERNWLIIPEIGNFRVTIWDVAPATLVNGPLALYVLNQPSFVDEEGSLSANRTLVANNAVVQDKANDRLFVGEQLNNGGRIKAYQLHNYLRRNQRVDFPNMTEPASGSINANANFVDGISQLYTIAVTERDQTATLKTVKNAAGSTLYTAAISNDGTTCIHGRLS